MPTNPKVRTEPLPVGGGHFPSVKKGRAALMARANETYEKLVQIIDMASASGDFETAAKYAWMLLEHTPKEDGISIIEESAAKQRLIEAGPRGPIIQIGVRLGGANEPKELPEAVVPPEGWIDVKPEP